MTTWQPDIYAESEPLPGDLAGGAYISNVRIALLSVVSMGLYWFYWMYRTWKQYRDHTAAQAVPSGIWHHPEWHSLTQLVPVYGMFRYHAHIRRYKDLMVERGVPDTLNLGLLTTVVVINWILAILAGTMRSPDLSAGAGLLVAGIVLSILTLIVTIVVLCVMQSNLNRYWASVDNRLMHSARFGKGEILCIILGVLLWIGVVADILWT